MRRLGARIDSDESRERRAPTRWCGRAAPWLLCLSILTPGIGAEAGDRGGSIVRLESSQSLARRALLHRGAGRGEGKMQALRAELVRLREELAQLEADPSPDRVGRALGHRQAITGLLAGARTNARADRQALGAAPIGSRSQVGGAPVAAGLETQVTNLLSEVDQVLVDPIGQGARLERVRRTLDDALKAPVGRGGLSGRLMTEADDSLEKIRQREALRR